MFHWLKKHTKEGLEIPDDTPIEVTLRTTPTMPLTIQEQLMRFTSSEEIKQRLKMTGHDTFDEADDFNVSSDQDEFVSPYEVRQMDEDDPTAFLQTRLDEQKANMAGEMPYDRLDRANTRLRAKKPNVNSGSPLLPTVLGDTNSPKLGSENGTQK